jgi:hypothetical protein
MLAKCQARKKRRRRSSQYLALAESLTTGLLSSPRLLTPERGRGRERLLRLLWCRRTNQAFHRTAPEHPLSPLMSDAPAPEPVLDLPHPPAARVSGDESRRISRRCMSPAPAGSKSPTIPTATVRALGIARGSDWRSRHWLACRPHSPETVDASPRGNGQSTKTDRRKQPHN